MKLQINNSAQKELCKNVEVFLNGKKLTDCVIADSDKGYVERETGQFRMVGMFRKAITKREEGLVEIKLNGRNI